MWIHVSFIFICSLDQNRHFKTKVKLLLWLFNRCLKYFSELNLDWIAPLTSSIKFSSFYDLKLNELQNACLTNFRQKLNLQLLTLTINTNIFDIFCHMWWFLWAISSSFHTKWWRSGTFMKFTVTGSAGRHFVKQLTVAWSETLSCDWLKTEFDTDLYHG